MKFSTLWLAFTAMVPSIAATGMQNTIESQDGSAVAYHRKLASEKYSFSGNGISVDQYWEEEGCLEGNYFYLSLYDGVSKYQANGKPSKTKSTYGWGSLTLLTDCDETSATRTYAYFDLYGGTGTTMTVPTNLNTASFNLDTVVFSVTETCTKICYADEYGEWCYYGDCTTISDGTAPVTVSGLLTASSAASQFSSKNTYKTPYYSSRYSSKGKERPASISLTIALNGDTIETPTDAYSYAYIQQTTSGEFYKF